MRQVFAPNDTCRFFFARIAPETKRKRRVMNPPPDALPLRRLIRTLSPLR
jgi:hypothetical protein